MTAPRCGTFKMPGPPHYGRRCQKEDGHKGRHRFGRKRDIRRAWERAVKRLPPLRTDRF